MAIRVLDFAAFACLLLLGITIYGHNYRYSIEDQLEAWNDGVQNYEYQEHPADSFDPTLYAAIRSVEDAAAYILSRGEYPSEEALLIASYDLVRSRFMHHMYPRHTWLTNPILAFLEFVAPAERYNGMFLADVILRHAAAASCGNVATTFVEVHRAVGGKAQFVTFFGSQGHQVAEVIADGKKYFVDVDLEVLAPFGALEFVSNKARVAYYYAHRSAAEIEMYNATFSQKVFFGGYEGLPTDSPRAYRGQLILEWAKFALPATLFSLCIALRGFIARRAKNAVPA